MTFLLTLLGFGKAIKDFLFKNWKITLVLIVAVCCFFAIQKYLSNVKTEWYVRGVEYEQTRTENIIKEQDKKNKAATAELRARVTKLQKQLDEGEKKRNEKVIEYKDRMNEVFIEKPVPGTCVVDPEVLNIRNKIREMGPK